MNPKILLRRDIASEHHIPTERPTLSEHSTLTEHPTPTECHTPTGRPTESEPRTQSERHILTLRHLSLLCGLLVLVICIAVPLPSLDYNTPFTAHMLRHVGLLLLAAPLLAMAIPSHNSMRKPLTSLSRLTARRPFVAWFAGIFTMWLWHVPILYNLSVTSGGILSCSPLINHPATTASLATPATTAVLAHAPIGALPTHVAAASLAAHASAAIFPASIGAISLPVSITAIIPFIHAPSLLLAGFIFCWPLITPYRSLRLSPLHSIAYLASACITCSLAGLLITFAPYGMFRGVATHDQQSGGLIMWVPCCFLYLSASMALLLRWLSQKDPVNLIHS